MDNISYHGTNHENAIKLVGPPSQLDINIGRGELGRGFYTGSSIALAAIWAQLRYKVDAVVVEFDIPKQNFVLLKGHLIKTKDEILMHWNKFKSLGLTDSFIFGHDYIIAPFATIEHTGSQFKFESKKAENELRNSNKTILKCGS